MLNDRTTMTSQLKLHGLADMGIGATNIGAVVVMAVVRGAALVTS